MKSIIVLDSSPLGLLFQKTQVKQADACRQWLKRCLSAGARVIVPEIVNYELRRELLRLRRTSALAALAQFNAALPGRYLPITTAAMELAAGFGRRPVHKASPLPISTLLISTSPPTERKRRLSRNDYRARTSTRILRLRRLTSASGELESK